MRLRTAVSVLVSIMSAAPTVVAEPIHQWSQQFGSSETDVGYGIATDGSGNLLVAGQYGSGGSAFVAKYDPSGVQVWIRWLGFGRSYDVTTDPLGNVLVTGALGTYPVSANPIVDIFLKKFDAGGTLQWTKTFVGPSYDEGIAVATDLFGNVAMTGRFTGTVDFGGGPLTSAGVDDIIVADFNTNGTYLWSRSFGSMTSDYGSAVVFDGSGGVIVTGAFHGSVDFGGGTLTSAGGFDMFVAKYDAGGIHQWSRRYGSAALYDYVTDVASVGSDFVITGNFGGNVDFGGGPLTSIGAGDVFVAKYDATGVHQWSKRFGTLAYNQGRSLAVDPSGEIVVTGYFYSAIDFGGGTLSSAGQDDIFLARFDANGEHQWSQRFGDTDYDFGGAVALDPTGSIGITGAFMGTVDFGGGPFTSVAGWEDMFLVKFAPAPTSVTPALTTSLGQNWPNPFNPTTTIEYSLGERSSVVLGIYNAAGALVAKLDQGMQSAGKHQVQWNGRDAQGRSVASGMYFYRLEGVRNIGSRKMVLLK